MKRILNVLALGIVFFVVAGPGVGPPPPVPKPVAPVTPTAPAPAPVPVSKQLCTCFCGSDKGAVYANKVEKDAVQSGIKSKMTLDACEQSCKSKKPALAVAVCAKSYEQYPASNQNCFTDAQCAAIKGEDGKRRTKDGEQAPECQEGSHYCFPLAEKSKAKLNIEIGGLKEVGDIGEYMGAVYDWMVTVSALFAIVMVMIGGLQYTLGGGMSEQITKGKERMKNGVIGMVLLFSVVLIMQNVNPQLLKMEVPKLSIVRKQDVVKSATCKELYKDYVLANEAGVEVPPNYKGDGACGEMNVVVRAIDPNKEVVPGTTCQWTGCADKSTNGGQPVKCVGIGKKAQCRWCGNITDINSDAIKAGLKPSPSLCKQFSTPMGVGGEDIEKRCIFSKDGDLTSESGITDGFIKAFTKVQTVGSCGFMQIDCKLIKRCSDYGGKTGNISNIYVQNESDGGPLSSIDLPVEDSILNCGGTCATANYKSVCEENPCLGKKFIACEWILGDRCADKS